MHNQLVDILAEKWGTPVEEWMTHPIWGAETPGCNNCALRGGPQALCWGTVRCHGFVNACMCRNCRLLDQDLSYRLEREREDDRSFLDATPLWVWILVLAATLAAVAAAG